MKRHSALLSHRCITQTAQLNYISYRGDNTRILRFTMTMRKTFQYLLVFYSIFLAARTAFSFKRICRVAGPTTGEYLVVRNSRNGVSDPSLINRNNFDTSLNMASIYGNMMGSNDLTKVTSKRSHFCLLFSPSSFSCCSALFVLYEPLHLNFPMKQIKADQMNKIYFLVGIATSSQTRNQI